MFNLKNRRECFFDDALLEEYTATLRIHQPVFRERVVNFDLPWEGDGSDFFDILKDGDLYRMYFLGWQAMDKNGRLTIPYGIHVCYAESKDGVHWQKPALGLCEWDGNRENNILFDNKTDECYSFHVFRDERPDCPKEEVYKAVAFYMEPNNVTSLHCLYSADGIHFKKHHLITRNGMFDSLNTAFWDTTSACYRCYFRNFHDPHNKWQDTDNEAENVVRDIRTMLSTDFIHWTEPVMLDFGDSPDIPLYTNNIIPYYRAPHQLIGLPTRYIERKEWNDSFDELCGREARLKRYQDVPRYGLTVTDCVFMTSRDGVHFKRYDEAFLPPEPENGRNWIYGDGYPAYGMIETPATIPGGDPELSIYVPSDNWTGKVCGLDRYTLRLDGFVSLHAGERIENILTKPFTFEGSQLYANLATSAWGFMRFTLIDANGTKVESCEMIGNSVEKRIAFPDGVVAALSGKPVQLSIEMRDADLYSIHFH